MGGATALIDSLALGAMLKGLPGGGSGGGSGNDVLGGLMKAGGGSSILDRGGGGGTGQERALLVVVALGTSLATYTTLKASDNSNDRPALAMAIDRDVAGQIPLDQTMAA